MQPQQLPTILCRTTHPQRLRNGIPIKDDTMELPMPYDPNRHHCRSIRLKGYDYRRPGAYFVTICTYRSRHTLGLRSGGKVVLNAIGRIACEAWQAIPHHFSHTRIDEFVIMPNHMHGIILIDAYPNGGASEQSSPDHQPTGTAPGSLAAIIQNFKSISTRRCNRLTGTPGISIWH
ncbi:MAG: transposase [Oscillochloris sp.]|nr:transposase [Oscillochloris sp.]